MLTYFVKSKSIPLIQKFEYYNQKQDTHYDYLPTGGGCEVLFSPGLSVCVCVSVWTADILVIYFSAIRRDIDLKFIQDTYRVVLNSLQRSRSQGWYIAF